jgi:prepilin peptidase CpaA
MTPDLIKTLVPLAFAGLVLAAALTDLATFTIPNWISVALAAAFVPAALLAGVHLADIGWSLALGVGVFILAAGMFALGWVGGGDAKLMASAALWVGLKGFLAYMAFTGLAGGALALGLLGLRSAWVRPLAAAGPAWTQRLATPGESAPYGVAIAIGALGAALLHPLV